MHIYGSTTHTVGTREHVELPEAVAMVTVHRACAGRHLVTLRLLSALTRTTTASRVRGVKRRILALFLGRFVSFLQ